MREKELYRKMLGTGQGGGKCCGIFSSIFLITGMINLKRVHIYIYIYICDDVVLRHTLPIFTELGRCPIVNWDFVRAVSIFGPDALPVIHQ